MKTTLDVLTILYQLLLSSSMPSEITGKVRKGERPAGSTKEDIVVNTLPIQNDNLQRTVANVNIYVPSLVISENGIQTEKPDYTRLDELVDMILPILKDVREKRDYYLEWQQVSQPIKDTESKSYFINIRVDFYAFNVN
jgi:hypothetical protein